MSHISPTKLIVTCEHGGNHVPPEYRYLFAGQAATLNSHRGFDIGALHLARRFSAAGHAELFFSTVTRLLIDLNRSIHHRSLFSEFTQNLTTEQCNRVLDRFWVPYRLKVESAIQDAVKSGRIVIHLSIHSFTPIWNGKPRPTDIGLLYDPQRQGETEFCKEWQKRLKQLRPDLTVHRNQPYRGIADGFVTYLRKQFSDTVYIGVELELNQKWIAAAADRSEFEEELVRSFQMVCGRPNAPTGRRGKTRLKT